MTPISLFLIAMKKFYVAIVGHLKGYHAWADTQKIWMRSMKVNVAKNEFYFLSISIILVTGRVSLT